jgi:uncharacterized membrane protein
MSSRSNAPTAGEPLQQLPDVLLSLGWLFAEAASIGLLVWGLTMGDALQAYALENQLPAGDRTMLLWTLLGSGSIAVVAAVAAVLRRPDDRLALLQHATRRWSPVLFVGLLPLLFRWQIWQQAAATFGVLVTGMGFALRWAIGESMRAGPLFPHLEWPRQVKERVVGFACSTARWLPLLIVILGVCFYVGYFSYYTVINHQNLRTTSFDLGLEDNLLYNLVHGGPFMKTSPAFGPVGSHFGYHATWFSYVIAIPYAVFPRAETLLVFQSVMIGAAAIPLHLWATRHLGSWLGCFVAVAYLLYPGVHGSNLYDFHYLPLGVVFLWLTLYLLEAGRFRWGALAALLALSVREDVAAGLVIIGAFLIFTRTRPGAGLILAGVAGAYFLSMKMLIMPHALGGKASFIHQWRGLLPPGESGFGGVLKTVLGNPIFTLSSLLEKEKFLYLVQLGAPLCFFFWRRPIGLLCTLPGFFFTMLATAYRPLIQISFQYTAHWTAFLFLALVRNLKQERQAAYPGDQQGPQRLRAWVITILCTTVVASYQYGAILQQNTSRGGFDPYIFGTTPKQQQSYKVLKSLISQIPPDAKVTSSEVIVPHVSNRVDAYTIRLGLYDADYALFTIPVRKIERAKVREALMGEFGVVTIQDRFVLAQRGYPKDKNHLVLGH